MIHNGPMRALSIGAVACVALLWGGFARAECTPGDPLCSARSKGGGNVITIGEVTIVGRVQKPIAAVDVSKIQPKLTLAELRQPFLDRIEEAVGKDPF